MLVDVVGRPNEPDAEFLFPPLVDAKAVAIYKQVAKIDAKRFDIYIPLADLYQRIGLTTDAMAALERDGLGRDEP